MRPFVKLSSKSGLRHSFWREESSEHPFCWSLLASIGATSVWRSARRKSKNRKVVSVIGDGAITAGMALKP
ncbi:hypothetical protein OH492_05300 [Vibrio chagasii]|nr:hypothetical protein [Vibrio chagasii]